MKRIQLLTIICIVVLSILLVYIHIFVDVKGQHCNTEDEFLSEIFTYDHAEVEITRKEVFISGKIKHGRVPLLVGIPTVYREHKNKTAYYLDKTMRSLLQPLSEKDLTRISFLIILADSEAWKRKYIYTKILKDFSNELNKGIISVIGIPSQYYRSLENIIPTFKDSPQRMYWRSKQCLDYMFIFDYVHKLCDYYMQIEDDVTANEKYFSTITADIKTFNLRQTNKSNRFLLKEYQMPYESWMVLEYYPQGFIGRLIPSKYLPIFSIFTGSFYNQLPVDWVYPHLLKLTSVLERADIRKSLFTHIGKQSSSLGT